MRHRYHVTDMTVNAKQKCCSSIHKTYIIKDTINVTTTPSIPTISVLHAIAEPALSKLALITKEGLGD